MKDGKVNEDMKIIGTKDALLKPCLALHSKKLYYLTLQINQCALFFQKANVSAFVKLVIHSAFHRRARDKSPKSK